MKRRDFMRGSLALGAAPLLPMPAIAKLPTASGLPPQLVLLSEHHAARYGTASAAVFARRMGVGMKTAEALASRVIKLGMARAPDAIVVKMPATHANAKLRELASDHLKDMIFEDSDEAPTGIS